MNKHTPGPWQLIKSIHPTTVLSSKGEGYSIASVYDPNRGSHATKESMANARLIAAAPDMLEALNMIITVHDMPSTVLRIAKEALISVQEKPK